MQRKFKIRVTLVLAVLALVILAAIWLVFGIRKHDGSLGGRGALSQDIASRARRTDTDQRHAPAIIVLGSNDVDSHRVVLHVVDNVTRLGIQGALIQMGPIVEGPFGSSPTSAQDLYTDGEGSCAIAIKTPSVVVVRAGGYISRKILFRYGDSVPADYLLALGKGSSIGGRVHSEKGEPISDVEITIHVGYSSSRASKDIGREILNDSTIVHTDATGLWFCNELDPELEYVDLTLNHPEYAQVNYSTKILNHIEAPTVVSLDELKAQKAIQTMRYGLLISGMVTDDNGTPIEGATVVHIKQQKRVSALNTGTDGRFHFSDGTRGEITLKVQADGFAPEIRVLAATPRMPEIVFKLGKGQIVGGRVIDEEERPVVGAVVRALTPNQNSDEIAPPWWETKTDVLGRFQWASAPSIPLMYMVTATGFRPPGPSDLRTLGPGNNHEIKLQRLPAMHLSGTVSDMATKMPIEAFRVTAVLQGSADGAWVEGRGGIYSLSVDGPGNLPVEGMAKYNINVEAFGYRADNSHVIEFKQGDWTLDIALVRGDGPSGYVRLASGEPASGANVFVCGGYLNNPRLGESQNKIPITPLVRGVRAVSPGRGGTFAATVADEAGRFSLSAIADPITIIATHEKGFAALTVQQLVLSTGITLQPWGQVEGILRIGSKLAAEQVVTLRPLINNQTVEPPGVLVDFAAQTDAEGKFRFPTVPPGEYRIARSLPAPAYGELQSTSVALRAGEVASVILGGRGRPVTGHVAVTGASSSIEWKNVHGVIVLSPTGIPHLDPQDRAGLAAWLQTDEGKKFAQARRSYAITIAEDGAFRAEDIDAGAYILTITLTLPDLSRPPGAVKSYQVTKEFSVDDMPNGRSDIALDLGTIILQINSKHKMIDGP